MPGEKSGVEKAAGLRGPTQPPSRAPQDCRRPTLVTRHLPFAGRAKKTRRRGPIPGIVKKGRGMRRGVLEKSNWRFSEVRYLNKRVTNRRWCGSLQSRRT